MPTASPARTPVRNRVNLERLKSKEHRRIAKAAQDAGWRLEFAKSGHLKFFNPEGHLVTTAPSTTSDVRSHLALITALRAGGLDVKRPIEAAPKPEQPKDELVDEYAEWAAEQKEKPVPEPAVAPAFQPVAKPPKPPRTIVCELLRAHPGVEWDAPSVARETGLDRQQVANALSQSLSIAGFSRPKRGRYVYSQESTRASQAALKLAESPMKVRTTTERRSEWEQDRHDALKALAEAEAKARADGKAELPTTFETISTDRLGRLVLKDQYGDIWLAAPVYADLEKQ